jgi:hypothetical protein
VYVCVRHVVHAPFVVVTNRAKMGQQRAAVRCLCGSVGIASTSFATTSHIDVHVQ